MNDDQQSKEMREAVRRENAARLIRAFRTVFGTSSADRTDQQKAVWEALEKACFVDRPTFIPNGNGVYDPIQGALCEGFRQSFLQIKALVEKNPDEQKPKPESIR